MFPTHLAWFLFGGPTAENKVPGHGRVRLIHFVCDPVLVRDIACSAKYKGFTARNCKSSLLTNRARLGIAIVESRLRALRGLHHVCPTPARSTARLLF